jgi:hypothetical protein
MFETTDSDQYPYGERRLTLRLLRYWKDLCGMRPMPEEPEIDPDVLGADWGYCFLLQSRDVANTQDYNFTYLGERIMGAYFDRELDEHNEFLVGPNAYRLSNHFKRVLQTGAPVIDEGEFLTLHARRVLFRQVLLPIGSEEKGVEAIFGGMNYKIVE